MPLLRMVSLAKMLVNLLAAVPLLIRVLGHSYIVSGMTT
uniref:Uncharacterized protein n=1 Tax=Picea glauca TaxID=3330 RepID=A0A117NFU3_PICGL|nr:hypothetical protein ABT39_MTgene2370 [Picea glauca]QHR92251.1 hypothetical protein Q903MT_gene6290 [Picea sitchensis]